MTEDVLNIDGTVDITLDCHIKMPLWDYKIMMALELMKDDEKEQLYHHSIPEITSNRVTPSFDEKFEHLNKHGRLGNATAYIKNR